MLACAIEALTWMREQIHNNFRHLSPNVGCPVDSFVAFGSATFGGQHSLASLPLGNIAIASAASASAASSSHHLDEIERQDLESRMFADFASKYGLSHQNVLYKREEQEEVFSNMR